jgi:hypothetical protein
MTWAPAGSGNTNQTLAAARTREAKVPGFWYRKAHTNVKAAFRPAHAASVAPWAPAMA